MIFNYPDYYIVELIENEAEKRNEEYVLENEADHAMFENASITDQIRNKV